jgi:hypothetical protein
MEGVADDVPGDCGGVEYSGVWVAIKRYPSQKQQKQKTATTGSGFYRRSEQNKRVTEIKA